MRTNLAKIDGKRLLLTATIGRFGTKSNYHGFPQQTICFLNVKDADNKILTDHVWFTVGKTIEKLNLQENQIVSFYARVSSYVKGYYKDEFDYKLNNISQLKLI
jgi:hypothetical protein